MSTVVLFASILSLLMVDGRLLGSARVVCVGPESAGNVGMIARACANFDAGGLALVAPAYDRADNEHASYERRFATQAAGRAMLDEMAVVPSLADASVSPCSSRVVRSADSWSMAALTSASVSR